MQIRSGLQLFLPAGNDRNCLDLDCEWFVHLFMNIETTFSKRTETQNNKNTLRVLRKNFALAKERLSKQGIDPEPFKIIGADAHKALGKIKLAPEQNYILWADPPYNLCLKWVETLSKQKLDLLDQTSLIIIESDRKLLKDDHLKINGWELSFTKAYGDTALTGWTKK